MVAESYVDELTGLNSHEGKVGALTAQLDCRCLWVRSMTRLAIEKLL